MDYLSPGTQPPGSKDDTGIELRKYKGIDGQQTLYINSSMHLNFLINSFGKSVDTDDSN